MVAHTLPTKKATKVSKAKKNIATYQIGVDILGFPIYLQHSIHTGTTKGNKINPVKKSWIAVEIETIKQH